MTTNKQEALEALDRIDNPEQYVGEDAAYMLQNDIQTIRAALEEKPSIDSERQWTGLYDRCGNKICVGDIVHWTDGGDDLSLKKRIKDRWDRIAVVSMRDIEPQFTVIDSPNEYTRNSKHTFSYGSFIWRETAKYLTVVAVDKAEYEATFNNAGECMAKVLEMTS